jgi:hypothetical protein
MWFHSLLASWKSGLSRSPRPCPQPARRRTRLVLEHLEDRALPSAYSAASVSALIADISAANTAGGSNTISLTAATTAPYVLTIVNNSTNGATGLPVIAANDNLTILGSGDTVERSTATGTPAFRLLEVASGGSLTLENLTLQGGLADCIWGGQTTRRPLDGGGAIYNQGTLVLNGVTAQNNSAVGGMFDVLDGINAAGGGIYSLGGSVTLEGGTIVQNNRALGGQGFGQGVGGNALGGGLYASGSTVIVTNATLDNNSALAGYGQGEGFDGLVRGGPGIAYGGGLYASGGTVNMTNATLANNVAENAVQLPGTRGYGGGLYLAAGTTATLDAATVAHVTGNTAASGAAYDNIDGTYKLT